MFGDQRRGDIARNLLAVRKARHHAFPSELFDEHAWSMLLHLFSALTDNQTVSEENLIQRSEVSVSIGQKWLRHLVADGQVEARGDGDDVALTGASIENMRRFLDEAALLHRTDA